jgi:GNAT superfamily N-acetyltransferase
LNLIKRDLNDVVFWAGGGDALNADVRAAVIELCAAAFEDDFSRLFERRVGAGHLIAYANDEVVGHLCWTYRRFVDRTGAEFLLRWVEAVAVRLDWQGIGLGSRMMERACALPSGVPGMALMAARESFYSRLGWIQWEGDVVFEGYAETGEQADDPIMVWSAEGFSDDVLERDVIVGRRAPVDPTELLGTFL